MSASRFLLLSLTLLFVGCSTVRGPDINIPMSEPKPVNVGRVRVAVVLGGGGARGLAHVGVLEVLEENEIPIDLIVGCSAGSMVGSLYADKVSATEVRDTLLHLKRKDLFDTSFWSALQSPWRLKAPIQGYLFQHFLHKNLSVENFRDLKIPFIAVATDLATGELIGLRSGPIVPAVRASCAIPPFFNPIHLYGRTLLDGGIVSPVPVCVAEDFNPDVIIAVELKVGLRPEVPRNMFSLTSRCLDIAYLRLSELNTRSAHVLIAPQLGDAGIFEDKRNFFLYNAGRKAALDALPEIRRRLAEIR